MKRILVVLIFAMALTSVAFAATPNMLEGKTFKGEVMNEGAKKADPDTFIFKDGQFRSTACDEYGFTAAPFTAAEAAGNTTFSATTKNDKGATIIWHGAVHDNKIEGHAVMTDAKGAKSNMTFHAKLEHEKSETHAKQ